MESAMDKQDEKTSQAKKPEAGRDPMAMGMGTARKMMSQMAQGGSPFEMMQKMMGMCVGMCAEILSAIQKTSALAVSATPELQHAFGEWLKLTEDEAMKLIASGTADTTALANALKISEASARYALNRLAESGKITITATATG